MSPTSVIGFHAAYEEGESGLSESGIANAEVGFYMTHLGLSLDAIRFATVAGPQEINLLTPDLAQAFGIEVILNDSEMVATSNDRPSGDDLARAYSGIAIWERLCSDYFGGPTQQMSDHQGMALEVGNALLGSELWLDYQFRALEFVFEDFEKKGTVLACLDLDNWFWSEGIPTSLSGPGFDCSRASTSTEHAICQTGALWADDKLMNDIYSGYRSLPESPERNRYFEEQRAWLRLRDSCGDNTLCLSDLYLVRLRLLAGRLNL